MKWGKPPVHGTYAGYQWHARHGVTACDPCKAALAAYMREYRKTAAGQAGMRRDREMRRRATEDLISNHRGEFQALLDMHRGRS